MWSCGICSYGILLSMWSACIVQAAMCPSTMRYVEGLVGRWLALGLSFVLSHPVALYLAAPVLDRQVQGTGQVSLSGDQNRERLSWTHARENAPNHEGRNGNTPFQCEGMSLSIAQGLCPQQNLPRRIDFAENATALECVGQSWGKTGAENTRVEAGIRVKL